MGRSVGSVCTALPTLLVPRTLITHGLQRLMGCILPTMHCRSQHCWELFHPFADHCQHARNNSQHCWVCLHAALKNKGCTLSIVRDREFSSSKQVLENKSKQPRLAGCGKRPNKSISIRGRKRNSLEELKPRR